MAGGLHPPLQLLLAWQTDAYPHGIRRDWSLVITCAVFFPITVLSVFMRLYSRFAIQRNVGLDDVFIIAAMFPVAAMIIIIALASRIYGFDRHAWDLTPELAVKSRKATMAISALYIAGTGLTKISILFFYRRMASGSVSKWFLYVVWANIAAIIAYMITFLSTVFLGCHPINSYWDQTVPQWAATHDWHCYDEGADMLTASAISVAQDFLACGLPLLLFWKLQISMRQKTALGAIFGAGLFSCICGLVRTVYIHVVYYNTYDITWAAVPIWGWTAVEVNVAIICASAPALKVFCGKVLQTSAYASRYGKSSERQKYSKQQEYVASQSQISAKSRGTKYDATIASVRRASTKDSLGPYDDVELAGIKVNREVDVIVESRDEDSFDLSESSDTELQPVAPAHFRSQDHFHHGRSWRP